MMSFRNVTEFCRRNTVIRGHMEPQRNVTCPSVAYTTVMKINSFRGDLTDISAKTERLLLSRCTLKTRFLLLLHGYLGRKYVSPPIRQRTCGSIYEVHESGSHL